MRGALTRVNAGRKTSMDSLGIDICLTAFSCSGSAPCSLWAHEYFNEMPRVVWVPGTNSTQFEAVGTDAGRDLVGWAAQRAKCETRDVRRIAVVTFSAGWGFVHRLLNSPARQRIDSIILLDGMHTNDLTAAKLFAADAANKRTWLCMAHSQIKPPFVSTSITNREVMRGAYATGVQGCEIAPEYVTSAVLDKPVTLGNQYGRRTFDHDPLVEQDNVGDAWRLEYEGDNAAIHIYCASFVQPRLWRWLGERWADTERGVRAL